MGSQVVERHRTILNLKRKYFSVVMELEDQSWESKSGICQQLQKRVGLPSGSSPALAFSLFDSSFFSVPAKWLYLLPIAPGVEWL